MYGQCPGSANIRTPTLSIKKCPECGREVEIFSSDIRVACDNCGFVIYNKNGFIHYLLPGIGDVFID